MRERHAQTGMYSVAVCAVALLVASRACAAPANWMTDPRTGCRVWNAEPLPNESVSWSGRCAGGMASGDGVAQWSEGGKLGQRYYGEFVAGQANGRGVLIFANGDRFEGQWVEDKLDGHGTATFTNGDKYSGEWLDGRRSGHGVFTHSKGDAFVYDGGFAADKKFGHGILRWRTGASFDGAWIDDVPNGFGILKSADGKTAAGIWKHGCLQSEQIAIGVTRAQCGFEAEKP